MFAHLVRRVVRIRLGGIPRVLQFRAERFVLVRRGAFNWMTHKFFQLEAHQSLVQGLQSLLACCCASVLMCLGFLCPLCVASHARGNPGRFQARNDVEQVDLGCIGLRASPSILIASTKFVFSPLFWAWRPSQPFASQGELS